MFDTEKHTVIDGTSWVRKSAVASDKVAAREAKRRNFTAEKPGWFARLFNRQNKETHLTILQEEALETDLADLHLERTSGDTSVLQGTYNGHLIYLTRKDG